MKSKGFAIVLILSIMVRIAVLMTVLSSPDRAIRTDSGGYIELATTLGQKGVFERDDQPEIFRTPGYPLFILAFKPFGDFDLRLVLIIQILLDSGTVVLTYLLTQRLFGHRVGLVAATLYALSPLAITYSVRIMTECLFTFLITLALYLLVLYIKKNRWFTLLASAIVTSIACYVRPAGLVLIIVVTFIFLLRSFLLLLRRKRDAGLNLVRSVIWVILVGALVVPWAIRNKLRADYFGFSSIGDYHLFAFEALPTLVAAEDISLEEARTKLTFDLFKEAKLEHLYTPYANDGWGHLRKENGNNQLSKSNTDGPVSSPAILKPNNYVFSKYWRPVGWKVLRKYWPICLLVHLKTLVGTLLPGSNDLLEVIGIPKAHKGTMPILREEGLWAAFKHYFSEWSLVLALSLFLIIFTGLKYVLAAVAGVQRAILGIDWIGWLFLLTFLAFILSPSEGAPRYRLPVEPLFCMISALGLTIIVGAIRRRSEVISN